MLQRLDEPLALTFSLLPSLRLIPSYSPVHLLVLCAYSAPIDAPPQILLSFQLKGHEKFLSKFRRLFRQFDTDKNGVLNEGMGGAVGSISRSALTRLPARFMHCSLPLSLMLWPLPFFAAEFRDLVAVVDPDKTEEDIDETLATIDPYQNCQMTFSECVSALSMDLVRMMGGAENVPARAPTE